jgi:hypothetical protein
MVDKDKLLLRFKMYFIGINISVDNIDKEGLFNSADGVKMINPAPAFQELPVRFGTVYNFKAVDKNLWSLKGSPQIVHREFDVDSNPLGEKGLRGGPQTVGGNYWCNHCNLTSLAGAPNSVGGGFYCSDNGLHNLIGAPETVGDDFFCADNPLKSLEGLPKVIPGELRLSYDPELPLLRTLIANMVTFANYYQYPASTVQDILAKYAGQGKSAMFDCQKDLEDAGFEENARW